MKQSIGSIIYQAVEEKRWLDIEYGEENKKPTRFWFALKDIDFKKDRLYGDIFNWTKSLECLPNPRPIIRNKIISVSIIKGSFYEPPTSLLEKISYYKDQYQWLECDFFDNNILSYLEECYELDNDPFLEEEVTVKGIDLASLSKKELYCLNDEQFKKILDKVLKMNETKAEQSFRYSMMSLAFNIFSIDISGKTFVVAYRLLNVDISKKTIRMEHEVRFNKTFLIDGGQKYNLTNYLSISATDFEQNFANNQAEYRAEIEKNYDYNEKTNTRPLIFLLRRNSMAGLQQAFEEIHLAQKEKRLTQPLKAFFGFNRRLIESSKNPYILAFDKNKINIDQIRVVYNSMVNRITYVQGPPGTGKTETIFNVLLTAFANDKKCLVCSNNNFPIDGIFEKMRNSFIYQRTLNSEKEKFYFPIIRIGNAEENIKAIRYLKEILNFVDRTAYLRVSEKRTLNSKFDSLAVYDSLRSDLKDYEKRKEIEQLLKSLKRWKDNAKNPYLEKMLNEQIEFKDKELLSIKEISNEDIQNNVVSSADSPDFMNYLFYASLRMLRRLLSPSNKQLKSIIEEEDEEEAAKKLVSYLKEDENVKRFTNIFPIVVTTNLSATKLGSPKQHFHLCIMDEAGQCNMASAILSIIRADDLLLVGDLNQLQPVTVLDRHLNTKLMEKYQVSSAYNYIDNSILKLMQTKDENSKKIFLRYHYRCGKKIIGFSNSRFYDNQLFLENLNDGNLYYKNVPSSRRLNAETNTALLEAEKIVEIIKTNKYDDVAIVTPFRNQAKLINSKLSEKGILNVTAGTIHTVQGTEKNTIIFSAAISLKTAARTMEWIKNNQELINVANTRAKKNLIFVGDRQAIDLKCGKEDSHLKSFSDYIASRGNYVVEPSPLIFKSDFSNDSRSEEVFFETISHYFEHRSAKFRAERNVLIKNMIKNLTREDKKIIGLREVDVLISIKTTLYGNYTPILVFEVDGGEHIGRTKTYKSDRLKENICKKYGIKTIRIPNSQVKNYELIISLFKMDIRNTENNQMSLFDDF